MPTDRGLKEAWRLLTAGGHRLHDDVRKKFAEWMSALDGVPDDDVCDAADRYVRHYQELQLSHPPTKAEAERIHWRRGKRWPLVADVARLLHPSVRRAPPTEEDLFSLRWWPPTGATTTADSWLEWSTVERRTRPHLEAQCRSAWHPHQRLLVLQVRHLSGWTPTWPNPRDLPPFGKLTQCGVYCAIKGPRVGEDHTFSAEAYQRIEGTGDPYLASLNLSAWIDNPVIPMRTPDADADADADGRW